MSESKGALIAKSVQKHAVRAKEKLLQNLGKVDHTADETFDDHVQNFLTQQNATVKLQKELNQFLRCVRALQAASKSLLEAVSDVYEPEWPGGDSIYAQSQTLDMLWQDYSHRLAEQVLIPLNTYQSQFPEMRKKIDKRGRKLVDYDSQRHNYQNLQNSNNTRKRDEAKQARAREALEEAKRTYEVLNSELHDELPALHQSRIPFLVSCLQTLFATGQIFHVETTKVYNELENVTDRLVRESHKGSFGGGIKSNAFISNNNSGIILTNSLSASQMNTVPKAVDHETVALAYHPNANANANGITTDLHHSSSDLNDDASKCTNASTNGHLSDRSESPQSSGCSSSSTKEELELELEQKDRASHSSSSTNHNQQNGSSNVILSATLADASTPTPSSTSASTITTTTPSPPVVLLTTGDSNNCDGSNSIITPDPGFIANGLTSQVTGPGPGPLVVTNSKINTNNNGSNNNIPVDNNNYSTGALDLFPIPPGASRDDLPPGVLYKVKATYKYNREDGDELCFDVGEVIDVVQYDDPEDQEEGWLMGVKESTGERGLFPANFTRPI